MCVWWTALDVHGKEKNKQKVDGTDDTCRRKEQENACKPETGRHVSPDIKSSPPTTLSSLWFINRDPHHQSSQDPHPSSAVFLISGAKTRAPARRKHLQKFTQTPQLAYLHHVTTKSKHNSSGIVLAIDFWVTIRHLQRSWFHVLHTKLAQLLSIHLHYVSSITSLHKIRNHSGRHVTIALQIVS
ncbi:hypothetical protein E3N88_00353 [Mikania micrantha]|uniref:Uncharacterized protein n=1 Tax=Mikania micrantha TaxID=192012 RepID=A0A5N6PZA3_9ASTR|nr:hypothetical protein E3N88_00353 [Mikania micrantha]